MKETNKGFSAVELILAVGVVGLLVAVGISLWQLNASRSKSDIVVPPTAEKTTSSQSQSQQGASNQTVETTTGYLVVKEWAVKVKMKDADKIGYTYNSASSDDPVTGEHVNSSIVFQIKPEFLQDKTCQLSIGWSRYETVKNQQLAQSAVKIGDYYFISSGNPYNCGNDADNALTKSIREDAANLEAQ